MTLGGSWKAGRGGKTILGGGKGICKDPEIIWNLLNQRDRQKTSSPREGWRGGRAQAAAVTIPILTLLSWGTWGQRYLPGLSLNVFICKMG